MRLVVLGWGNGSRGDDGLGPELLARVEAAGGPDIVCVEDYQLQIEHALDLVQADLALFVDAQAQAAAPFTFREIGPDAGLSHTTHALAPGALLEVFRRVERRAPPPSFALGLRGEDFELGAAISPAGAAALEAAWDFARELLRAPSPERWRALAASGIVSARDRPEASP